jgi:GNAT superfamily N-acetyltransferase
MTDDAPQRRSEFVAEHIAAEQSCVLVAESGPELVGMRLSEISFRPPVMRNPTYGAILDLAVTERSRRRGIGTLLFEKTKAWFGEHGINRIELRVLTHNPVASTFWERRGFRTYIEVRYLDL